MRMEGKGGCCVTRYATGAYDMSKMEKIMLRFRPIAPKPVAGAAVSDGSSSESGEAFSRSAGRVAKRKYTKDGNGTNRRRRKTAASAKVSPLSPAVTLPLLPETPDPKDPLPVVKKEDTVPAAWLSFGESTSPAKGSVVVLTVECVTDTWQKEVGKSNEETMRVKLSQDTCPGFISDGYGNVTWTNGAFNGMVGGGGWGEGNGNRRVWLVTNAVAEAVASAPYCGGFTCRVRMQREDSNTDLTVPCDVWRIIDGSGFAWRLDVNAALTLSLAL